MRKEITRADLKKLVHQVPFHPFLIHLENGERIVVEHPENVAFDPRENGKLGLYVITSELSIWSNLEAVSSLAALDRERADASAA